MYILIFGVAVLIIANLYLLARVLQIKNDMRILKHAVLLILKTSDYDNREKNGEKVPFSRSNIDWNFMTTDPDAELILPYL